MTPVHIFFSCLRICFLHLLSFREQALRFDFRLSIIINNNNNMKINKSILAGTLVLLSAVCPQRSNAEEEAPMFRSLTVTSVDGKQYGFNLVNEMSGTFNENADFVIMAREFNEDGSAVIDPDSGMVVYTTYFTIPGTELKSVEFSEELSGVTSPKAGRDFDIFYDIKTSQLRISGAEGKTIAIFSTDSCMESFIKGESDTVINMGRFGAGVHIVKIDTSTFKLLVK